MYIYNEEDIFKPKYLNIRETCRKNFKTANYMRSESIALISNVL